ncbi:hypothetical protein ACSLOD_28475, partial [Escherichia coli]
MARIRVYGKYFSYRMLNIHKRKKCLSDALNRDIATIHSNIVQEYNTLKGYSWKWLGGVSVAFLVMFCV